MKTRFFIICVAVFCTLLALTKIYGTGTVADKGDPRSGEKIEMTLSCPECSQLMTGQFRYCNNATTTVICPKCHKHWLVHYDWVNDPESARAGHWQFKLRIISIKKS